MIPMTFGQVATAIGEPPSKIPSAMTIRRVSTDSREVAPGDLFVAIRGDRFDGHDFVEQAAARGAAAAIVRRGHGHAGGTVCLETEDTIVALGRLAEFYRGIVMSETTRVVAITGSNGKTTTKCMIDHVLRSSFPGRASKKSFNNAIGVPLTMLSSEPEDRYVVAEIGTNARGEVAALAAIASPDVAVITSIGEAHLEGLSDLEGVAAEKASLISFVRSGGVAVVTADSPELASHLPTEGRIRVETFGTTRSATYRLGALKTGLCGTAFQLRGQSIELPLPGAHHALNAAAAFAVGRWFGLSPEAIAERLREFEPPEGRANRIVLGGITVIDDSYNANPASMIAAINTLGCSAAGRRVFVMGDMLELGGASGELHGRVLEVALEQGVDVLIAVGPCFASALLELNHLTGIRQNPGGPQASACTIGRSRGSRGVAHGLIGRPVESPVAEHLALPAASGRQGNDARPGQCSKDGGTRLGPNAVNGSTNVMPCDDADEALELLKSVCSAGDTVWVKGSRALNLDHVVRGMCQTGGLPDAAANVKADLAKVD